WSLSPRALKSGCRSATPAPASANYFGICDGMKVLVPARGGPQAELALQISQDLMDALGAEVTVLHVLQDMPERDRATEEAPFTELLRQLESAPRRPRSRMRAEATLDPAPAARDASRRAVNANHNPAGTISDV